MRLLRIIMEGLLVAFLAALGVYLFRDHIVFGLVVGTLVCGWGLTSIALIEHTQGHHKRGASPPKPEARIPSIDADRPTYQPSHHVLGNGEVRLIIANLRELPMEATCIVGDRDGPDSS